MPNTEYVAYHGTHACADIDSAIERSIENAAAIATKQDALTTAQLAAVNSGIDSTKVAAFAAKQDALTTAQMAAVNSGIDSETLATLEAKQDALTTEQLAAVNSGIDSTKVAQIATNAAAAGEVNDAKTDESGTEYDTLKERLDTSDAETAKSKVSALASCDLDDITDNGIWMLVSGNTYQNLPDDYAYTAGYLFCFALAGWNVQFFIPLTRKGIYRRASNSLNPWQDWVEITDDGLKETLENTIKSVNHNNSLNRYDVLEKHATHTDQTDAGITYAWTGDVCSISGTASGNSFNNLFNANLSGTDFKAGNQYYLLFNDAESSEVYIRIYFSPDGSSLSSPLNIKKSGYFTIPAGTVKMIVRFQIDSGTQVSCDTFCTILNIAPIENYPESHTVQLSSCDLNDLRGNHSWLIADNRTYEHLPSDKAHKTGYLFTYELSGWRLQLFMPFTYTGIYRRASNNGTTWQDWTQVADGGGDTYITNEYTVTATPSITTDTNNFLAATGDNTDVTYDIITMLQTTGECHLGTGDFYVSGVDMPDNTMLIGCGTSTRVILLGTNNDTGYAIKLGNRCSVKDMSILGNTTDILYENVSSTIVNRHGILFEATYTAESTYKERCNIENVWIRNFAGGGITCNDTGYGTSSCVNVINAYIYQCNAGIYVPYWSEFHRFTNVHSHNCYYGAVNNGGNCSFVNCGFSGNRVGMIIDNSNGQSPNNSHGQVVGCIFDHSDANHGVGIKLLGARNGQIFSDCQVFYSGIEVNNCSGIQFNNFNCGGGNVDITVTKGSIGGLILFNNFVFLENSYSISVESGYTACKFNNCWTRGGTAVTG